MSAPTPAEYRARLVAAQRPLTPARRPLVDAIGCVLAEDVLAAHPIPLFDNSSMDGYAVLRSDVEAASAGHPVVLPVVADIPAGATAPDRIAPGQAARIMTGAPMPAGADAVVQVEKTDGGTQQVRITGGPGEFVRATGADVAAGDLILAAGRTLTARDVASAAASGHGDLLVHPRPRVAVLSTGTELVLPGQTPGFGQIPDANATLLAGLLQGIAQVIMLPPVGDDEETLRTAVEQLDADALITSGGVSVGAYDVTKAVLAPLPDMWFGPIQMQPGKPQGFGHLPGGTAVFTLPGNPVSTYVSFEVLVRPALRRLAGAADVEPAMHPMTVSHGWHNRTGREQYMPVRIEEGMIRPSAAGGSGSHLIGSLAAADGLARVPLGVSEVRAGDTLELLEASA